MISDSQAITYLLRPDVLSTVMESGAVLLDLTTNYFYSVNDSGWAILQMYESGTTSERVQAQCQAWGAGQQDREEIDRFIALLAEDNLLAATEWPPAEGPIAFKGPWAPPTIDKGPEPLQRIMKSAFDPTLPLAE